MKLIIPTKGGAGRVVSDDAALEATASHRVHEVAVECVNAFGTHYRDEWGGTWFVTHDGDSSCTVGVMDRWS